MHPMTPIIAMTILAGTPASVLGTTTAAQATAQDAVRLDFHKASALRGTTIRNSADEAVGTVEDFIIDRGSGRIEYVILRDGGILGFGGRQVAVPYGAFDFDRESSTFRLQVSPERLEQAREFVASEWMVLDGESWGDELETSWTRSRDDGARRTIDPYLSAIKDGETRTFEGTIRDINRERTAGGGEQIVLDIDTGGRLQRVIVGPGWYVMSQDLAPMRAAKVEVTAFELPRDGGNRLVAQSIESDAGTMTLRESSGEASWETTPRETERDAVRSPWVLLKEVEAMSVRARTDDGGDVEGSIIEATSGQVAMLTIDPDDNILGIGDDIRIVPWSIAAIGTERVRLDADKSMLLDSKVVLEDVSEYDAVGLRSQVFAAMQVDSPSFEPRERTDWDPGGSWSNDGALAKAIRDGQDRTIKGEVVRATSMSASDGMARSVAVVVRTDDGLETIILGPKWFIDRQELDLAEGDRIVCECRVATLKQGTMVVASSVREGSAEKVVLWRDGRPVWDAS